MNKYFQRKEFECQCGCGFAGVDAELLTALTKIREHFNAPIPIVSGNRCKDHNASVGGAPNSYHVRGMAADFTVKDVEPKEVVSYINQIWPNKFGVGQYNSWTHLDSRPNPVRWKT